MITVDVDVDVIITRNPPKCKLCARTLTSPFGEMFLALFDTPEVVVEKHQGVKICYECYDKLKMEIGISTQ